MARFASGADIIMMIDALVFAVLLPRTNYIQTI
jgi:hypothetical protein